ncbi:hypothetical protein AMES_2732 [Amycolatopsis mediterranei S699]|uniref:DUF3616 domain-containing protein n=2 Tax=Amycolatopsis mediterranei TaxID=33910 RepID=A0A0H3D1N2_AMYMU|nr:hypothetical protein [Amycolatopsis mediterranei]ADJ44555.1 hypothetical protein AMED_2760 [Amycolatopsis mediterranei U32]AEK41294.1 hypothetical protein RAM_14030 [Amycolatopsis mediterranei S699]AFO76268.1 hypothetical protein AMES_2732 [Amycolatopsis mediterranei S699]AGT83397.1 hypothetical protein B737_2733 [Amycolatopsis mediterranei RB]KDO07087.1 hypothetical protein DV26_30510 [Amycolatopsis mediterranei]
MAKVRPTPFPERNGKVPFNASGVAQVGSRRFVFVDNKDPTALFEMTFDSGGGAVERIHRRPLAGLGKGNLRDPEGLTRVDVRGEIFLVVSSSLCAAAGNRSCDGLVRVRYAAGGKLPAEPMAGFRDWLLAREPTLAAAGRREPDAGGLNVEGLAWDRNALLFGLRGPAEPGCVTLVRIPADVGGPRWTTAALGHPELIRVRLPHPEVTHGVRDISGAAEPGDFLLLLGRSTSRGDAPFRLGTWNRGDDRAALLDVSFHRTAKPEGVTPFPIGGQRILIVDDAGGYAVL